MPDGTLVKNVPDNITQADLLARYNAFSAQPATSIAPEIQVKPQAPQVGPEGAPIPPILQNQEPPVPEQTILQKLVGVEPTRGPKAPGVKELASDVYAAAKQFPEQLASSAIQAYQGKDVETIADEESTANKIVEDARKTLEKLREQRDTFSKLREDFAKTATDFGSVTTLQTQGPVTAEGITANLRQRLQIVKQFSAALTKLQGAGLGPNALTDIIGLGPFEGLQYANAILAGGATTINDIKNISGQFQQPANIIGNIGAESVSGTTAAALDQSTNFKIDAGAIQITINGEITGETTEQIRNAVTAAFRDVGKEQRNRGKVGVR
jgi:hypothetical protein